MRARASIAVLLALLAPAADAQQRPWDPAVKECDRACLVSMLDGYMGALCKRDPALTPPLAKDVRMTENTGPMSVGEGLLWRAKTEPTTFKVYVADPAGQVALQTRLKVQGRE